MSHSNISDKETAYFPTKTILAYIFPSISEYDDYSICDFRSST